MLSAEQIAAGEVPSGMHLDDVIMALAAEVVALRALVEKVVDGA